jgi:hypothetical protein
MREYSSQLINFCGTGTDPAAETKSIGLQADASASWRTMFFARNRDYFIVKPNCSSIYRDIVPFNSFTVTPNTRPSTRTSKKLGTATQKAPH